MASYIEQTLMPGEHVCIDTRPHKILFAWPIAIVILGILIDLFGGIIPGLKIVIIHHISTADLLSALIVLFGLVQIFKAMIQFRTSEYIVTNKRVVMKTGLMSVNVMEILLTRMEAVHVSQSFWARFYDYGSLVIVGVGGTRDYFTYVPSPFKFRQYIQEMRSEKEHGRSNSNSE